jgi:hypothetical protein
MGYGDTEAGEEVTVSTSAVGPGLPQLSKMLIPVSFSLTLHVLLGGGAL